METDGVGRNNGPLLFYIHDNYYYPAQLREQADGQTYERLAIARWLQGNDTSPLTNAKLPHKNLVTNFVMLRTVADWCRRHPLYDNH